MSDESAATREAAIQRVVVLAGGRSAEREVSLHTGEQVVEALRGSGHAVVVIDSGDDVWLLEGNTIPGMTCTSLLPDAARAAGIEFPELCDRLVALALEPRG